MMDLTVSLWGSTSHEIRSGLMTILGHLSVLESAAGQELAKNLEGIRKAVGRIDSGVSGYELHKTEGTTPRISIITDLCNGCYACTPGIEAALKSCRAGALIKEGP